MMIYERRSTLEKLHGNEESNFFLPLEAQTTIEEQPAPMLSVSALASPLMWDCGNVVADALRHHAQLGDVQMAASALLVLGDKRRALHIDEATQEHWMLGYIDFLGRHKLYNVASQVDAKSCQLYSIRFFSLSPFIMYEIYVSGHSTLLVAISQPTESTIHHLLHLLWEL